MKQTLQDLQVQFSEPIPIFYDNTNAINISKNPVMHSKIKHIPIKYHFVREQVAENNIKLEYVIDTKEQIVDIFTKPLDREAFEYLHWKLGILPSSHLIFLIHNVKGEWKCVQVHRMVVFQGELAFAINVKGGENVVGRGVMIARGVLVLPSTPKGEIVDQRLSLISTQEEPGANPILHGNFYLPN